MYELYQTDTFKSDIKKLDKSSQKHLLKLLPKILENPRRFKPLKGLSNHYRLRFEHYRLVYKVEEDKIILLLVRKRDVVYKSLLVNS